MTSGTKTWDERTYRLLPWQNCYTNGSSGAWLGRVGSKTWSGSNTPKAARKPFTLRTVSYTLFDRKGRATGTRTRTLKEFPQGERAPMRENPYTFEIADHVELAYQQNVYGTCPVPPQIPSPNSYEFSVQSTVGLRSGYDDPSTLWGANDSISLIGRLSDRLGAGFNLAVTLGEGKQTLGTIATAASRIAKAGRQLRRGNLKGAANTLVGRRSPRPHTNISPAKVNGDWLSSSWLELQYGWMPLLRDVYSAAEHLAHMQSRPTSITFRVRMNKQSRSLLQPSPSYQLRGSKEYGRSIKAIVRQVDEVALIGLKDPASLAWELLPWSFVADWFIPVGNYLEALNLNRALTATYVTSWKYKYEAVSAHQSTPTRSFSAYFQHRWVVGGRTVSSSLNVPLPKVKPLSEALSWRRAVSSISLVWQAFKH